MVGNVVFEGKKVNLCAAMDRITTGRVPGTNTLHILIERLPADVSENLFIEFHALRGKTITLIGTGLGRIVGFLESMARYPKVGSNDDWSVFLTVLCDGHDDDEVIDLRKLLPPETVIDTETTHTIGGKVRYRRYKFTCMARGTQKGLDVIAAGRQQKFVGLDGDRVFEGWASVSSDGESLPLVRRMRSVCITEVL